MSKEVIRYQSFVIPGKMKGEVRINIDTTRSPIYVSSNGESQVMNIGFFPIISLIITRPSELDENGQRVRAPWNPNDSLGMTKYLLPRFISELGAIIADMKTPNLYTYHGKRLELDEGAAEKIRRVFTIGTFAIELSAVVITQLNKQGEEERVEGIKVKFNNEQSAVSLTLNEVEALHYELDHLDVDSVSMLMYLTWLNQPDKSSGTLRQLTPPQNMPKVDILPKADFKDDFV